MVQATRGSTVLVHYTAFLRDGTLVESTAGDEPLRVTIGQGGLPPGVEEAIEGMAPGESKTLTVSPEVGFGDHDRRRVASLDGGGAKVGGADGLLRADPAAPGSVREASGLCYDGQRLTVDARLPWSGREMVVNIELVEVVDR